MKLDDFHAPGCRWRTFQFKRARRAAHGPGRMGAAKMTATEIAHALGGKRTGRLHLRCPARGPNAILEHHGRQPGAAAEVPCRVLDPRRHRRTSPRGLWDAAFVPRAGTTAQDRATRRAAERSSASNWPANLDGYASRAARSPRNTRARPRSAARSVRAGAAISSGLPVGRAAKRCRRSSRHSSRSTSPTTTRRRAILRVGLNADGRKIGKKMLGPVGGCAIKLDADEDVTLGLGIRRRPRDRAGGLRATGWRPMWCSARPARSKSFPLLAGIEALTVFADHDCAGLGAAQACAERWQAAGCEVFIRWPKASAVTMPTRLRHDRRHRRKRRPFRAARRRADSKDELRLQPAQPAA